MYTNTAVAFPITLAPLLCVCGIVASNECTSENDVRLVGFESVGVGMVEVCRRGVWSAVCRESSDQIQWSLKNSLVVCRQLSYGYAIPLTVHSRVPPYKHSTSGFAVLQCSGLEHSVAQCSIAEASNCLGQHPLVMCTHTPPHSSVRLVGGVVQTGHGMAGGFQAGSGVVEVFREGSGWSALCTDGWGGEEAAVVCRQLGYPAGTSCSVRLNRAQALVYSKRSLNMFQCNGTEETLLLCSHYTYHKECYTYKFAAVTCSHTTDSNTNDLAADCTSVPLETIMVIITVQMGIALLILMLVVLILCAWQRGRTGKRVQRSPIHQGEFYALPSYEESLHTTLIDRGPTETTPTTGTPPTTTDTTPITTGTTPTTTETTPTTTATTPTTTETTLITTGTTPTTTETTPTTTATTPTTTETTPITTGTAPTTTETTPTTTGTTPITTETPPTTTETAPSTTETTLSF